MDTRAESDATHGAARRASDDAAHVGPGAPAISIPPTSHLRVGPHGVSPIASPVSSPPVGPRPSSPGVGVGAKPSPSRGGGGMAGGGQTSLSIELKSSDTPHAAAPPLVRAGSGGSAHDVTRGRLGSATAFPRTSARDLRAPPHGAVLGADLSVDADVAWVVPAAAAAAAVHHSSALTADVVSAAPPVHADTAARAHTSSEAAPPTSPGFGGVKSSPTPRPGGGLLGDLQTPFSLDSAPLLHATPSAHGAAPRRGSAFPRASARDVRAPAAAPVAASDLEADEDVLWAVPAASITAADDDDNTNEVVVVVEAADDAMAPVEAGGGMAEAPAAASEAADPAGLRTASLRGAADSGDGGAGAVGQRLDASRGGDGAPPSDLQVAAAAAVGQRLGPFGAGGAHAVGDTGGPRTASLRGGGDQAAAAGQRLGSYETGSYHGGRAPNPHSAILEAHKEDVAAQSAAGGEHVHRGATSCRRLLLLTLQCLGVVYGDIGTSPLYSVQTVFATDGMDPVEVTEENVRGVLSLMIWSLLIIVTFKYVAVVVNASNRGQGGIMALIALVNQSKEARGTLKVAVQLIGVFGAAMFYGDGVITPAISVLSAVEGLRVAEPNLQPFVIPITLVVLISLFFVQQFGTSKIGGAFGPVMLVWFITIAVMGIAQIIRMPNILLSFSPYYAASFFARNGTTGFVALGAVVLSVTGGETLYADMGHFGIGPIRLGWLGFVLPCLLCNYFGQGVTIIQNPETAANPFYLMAPASVTFPLVVLATAATIIASQAVISGAFSVTKQAMQLGYVPQLTVKYTSASEAGQIYLPAVNWIMLIITGSLVLGFGSSNALAAAYGIAVCGDMMITSTLACLVFGYNKGWGMRRAISLFVPHAFVEVCFFASNLLKVPGGGWFPLVLGFCIFGLMTTWRAGNLAMEHDAVERGQRESIVDFTERIAATGVVRVAGTVVVIAPTATEIPRVMLIHVMHNRVLHERVVIVSVVTKDLPTVPDELRVQVVAMRGGCYFVRVRFGFMDDPDIPAALALCGNVGLHLSAAEVVFMVGRDKVVPRHNRRMLYVRKVVFSAMKRLASSATDYYELPASRVLELGTYMEL